MSCVLARNQAVSNEDNSVFLSTERTCAEDTSKTDKRLEYLGMKVRSKAVKTDWG